MAASPRSSPWAARRSRYRSICRRACSGVSAGAASQPSPRRAARSIAGGAAAPIQTSTGSAGRGATRARSKRPAPVARDLFARPQPAQDRERLLEARRALLGIDAHRRELPIGGSDRALQDEAAAAEARQRAHLLGDEHRMPQRQQVERAERSIAPLGEQASHDRGVLVVGLRRRVMVADEERVEAAPARRRARDRSCAARPRADRRRRRRW